MKVGLQLYSIREALASNVPGTLKAVKEMGYDYVELAGGRYGLTGKEMKKEIENAGLTCVSIHSSPSLYLQDREDVLSYMKDMGVSYTVIPCPPAQLKSYTENWDETLRVYEEMGHFFKENGLQLLYHNHDYDFKEIDGKVIIDTLLDKLKEVVMPQPDLAWVSYAGTRPSDFLSRHKGRVPVVHIKDYICENLPKKPIWQLLAEGHPRPEKKSLAGFDYAPIGQGVEIWDEALKACKEAGAEYLIVEQDSSPDPMRTAAESRAFLKNTFNL